MRNIPPALPRGYDVPGTAGFYRERLERVPYDNYAALFWFEKALGDGSSVVEIGGHVGVAYYSFEKVIRYPENLRWTIVDVPSVADAGRQLANERGRTNLLFVHELSEAQPSDILFASGALQYFPSPLLPERVRAMSSWPRHIIINETPVTRNRGYVTLQNLGVSFCPYRIHSYSELIQPFVDMEYELVDWWQRDRRVIIAGRPDCTVDHYSGYYLRRRTG